MGENFERAPMIPGTPEPEGNKDTPETDQSSDEAKHERVIQTYNKKAKELGLNTDKTHQALLGEYIIADGMESAQFLASGAQAQPGRVPTNTENTNVIRERLENIGHYATNNGVISWINEKGEMLVAPLSDYIVEQLRKSGYENGEFLVPLSNGQEPTDENLRKKWRRMRDHERERKTPYIQRENRKNRGQTN